MLEFTALMRPYSADAVKDGVTGSVTQAFACLDQF